MRVVLMNSPPSRSMDRARISPLRGPMRQLRINPRVLGESSRRTVSRMRSVLLALVLPSLAAAQTALGPSAGLVRWAKANAIPMRPVDEPYADSAYDFLRALVGQASVLSLGELMHGAHEPLEFRNHAIEYAVTKLGFTAVAIESGLTEGIVVDRFVQGGAGNIDSVMSNGFTNGFGRLGENRELVLWLREHNARNDRKVHFYGIDVPGAIGGYTAAPRTPRAALDYLERVAPSVARGLRADLDSLLDRFTSAGFLKYSGAEREQLRRGLDGLEAALLADSSRYIRATSPIDYTRAVRIAWDAQRLHDTFIVGGPMGPRALEAIRLRDSVMFENAKWVLAQQGSGGRLVVFAHNGHSMNVPLVFPAMGPPMVMLGQRLRSWLGPRMVAIGTATGKSEGLPPRPSDMSTFETTLGQLGLSNYALDLRTGDASPEIAAMLRAPWLTWIHSWFQPIVPRDVADMFVVFDHVTASKDHFPPR